MVGVTVSDAVTPNPRIRGNFMFADSNMDIGNYKLFATNANTVSKEEKVKQFISLLHDPDIKEVLNSLFAEFLATSELKVLKRLASIEQVLGLNDFTDFEDEHEPTIPEQITELKIEIKSLKLDQISPDTIKAEIPVHKDTTAEQKVNLLMTKLEDMSQTWSGKKSLDHLDLKEFVKTLPEKLRGKDTNERRLISRILKKAEEMYPDKVKIHKNEGSRHESSIFLKSYQSKGTVRTPMFLAGELL